MRSTVFVLSILGAVLSFNGAVSNWWSSRFPSAYLHTQIQLTWGYSIAFAVCVLVAVVCRLTRKPR